MAGSKRNDLVVRPSSEIIGSERRTPRVIEQMVRDVLVRATSKAVSSPRFYIGDTALREPDYRQILRWAEAIKQTPEALLATLKASRIEPDEYFYGDAAVAFVLEDGAMVSLAWVIRELSPLPDVWEPGLLIQTLSVRGSGFYYNDLFTLRPDLPKLRTLIFYVTGLERLDLDLVPGLTELDCYVNQLTELDLSPVPGLNELNCGQNKITELDLSPVPGLTRLWCTSNHLTKLDLSPVPGLTKLACGKNQLSELDLSPVPQLTELKCGYNQLTDLNLSPVPRLTELGCSYNQLTELNLSPVPGLTRLWCNKYVRILNPPQDLKITYY
jgi:hypothetical protein